MITGQNIKELRNEHGLTQLQLARAIFVEESTIANYEAGRRALKVDTLEAIANVFGYSVELTLVKKQSSKRNTSFFERKTFEEISSLSTEDLTDYIFITQENKVLSKICDLKLSIIESLELSSLKDLIRATLSRANRLVVYFKLNNLHEHVETDTAILIDEMNEYFINHEDIPNEILEQIHYIDFDLYGDIYRDELEFDEMRLLDKNQDDLNITHETIINECEIPLANGCQPYELLFYIKANPISEPSPPKSGYAETWMGLPVS